MTELFAGCALPMRAVVAIRDNQESIGTDGTVRADHAKAETMLKADLCELFRPKPDPLNPRRSLQDVRRHRHRRDDSVRR
jgi:hypothetical protein